MNNKYFLTLSFIILGTQFCMHGMVPIPPVSRSSQHHPGAEEPEYFNRGSRRDIPPVFIFSGQPERDSGSSIENESLKKILVNFFKVGAALGVQAATQRVTEAVVLGGVGLAVQTVASILGLPVSTESEIKLREENQQLRQAINQIKLLKIQMMTEKHAYQQKLRELKIERKELEIEQLRQSILGQEEPQSLSSQLAIQRKENTLAASAAS